MSFNDIYDQFLQLEDELSVFDIRVRGIPVWERVRFEIIREIFYQKGLWSQATQDVEKTVPNVAKGAYLWGKNLVRRNPFLADQHDFLFWGHERRKKQDDGLWWDIFCDPYHEALDLDYVHAEKPYVNRHFTPAKTDNLRYLELIEYTGTLQREVGLARASLPPAVSQQLDNISARLQSEFDVDIKVRERVKFRLQVRKSTKPLYDRLLDAVDPAVVIVVVSFLKETFIETCNERGIPVVELQHGILTQYEYGYPGDRTKETFPDYLFSFGDFWGTQVELPIPDERVLSIGYPHFERRRNELDHHGESDQVLFISQGNIGEELSQMAVELAQSDGIDPSTLVYKLHPSEYDRWRRDYPWLADTEFEVIDSNEPGLYTLFAESTAQVGVYSTAMFEGLGFELATYLIDLPGVEMLSELYTNGYAELVTSVDELREALLHSTQTAVDTTMFFEPDPITNFSQSLREIAGKRID